MNITMRNLPASFSLIYQTSTNPMRIWVFFILAVHGPFLSIGLFDAIPERYLLSYNPVCKFETEASTFLSGVLQFFYNNSEGLFKMLCSI